ncbi:hypothetical protein E3P99_04106 [Wallemia hederae]|uniref:Uncharacterized protein n=1 Tax=Wallemia hederae TaxID=1540922 RepID=A0A4T0FCR6_9BASI|nr:hypothetical protein E3P99_04106 [Wallemia hederae]
MAHSTADTKTIVFGSVIATGIFAVIVFVVVICWQIRRKAADYKDEEHSVQYENTDKDKVLSTGHKPTHINFESTLSTPSTRSSASSFFNKSNSWLDHGFERLLKNKEATKGVRFSETLEFSVNHDPSPPPRWSFERGDSRSSLAYLSQLPHKPKPAANKTNHLTLMVDKDMVKDVLPSYYEDEDSVYNVYHERCKSLR